MANNRKKKEINSRQAHAISVIISGIYFICVFLNGLIQRSVGELAVIYYWCIVCCVVPFCIYYIFYVIIFKGEYKASLEKEHEIETIIRKHLSTTDYKQVYLFYETCDIMDMVMQILQKEGCKFYAKLTENDSIYLIAKDEHNEEVYSAEIENPFYFYSYFKFDEQSYKEY